MQISDRKPIKRQLQLQLTQLWYVEISARVAHETGEHCSPQVLAKLFPTTKTLRIQDSYEDQLEWSKININYWSRVQRGRFVVKDRELIDRVEKYFWGTKKILYCPTCELLCNSRASSKQLNEQLETLAPNLENYVFTRKNSHLFQKKVYKTFISYHIVASSDFLAYQLILLRQMKLHIFPGHFYLSLKEVTLLLLRTLMATPLLTIADTVLELYFYFIVENANDLIINKLNFSQAEVKENPLLHVVAICLPEAQSLPYMQSFNKYKTYHQKLLEKAKESFLDRDERTQESRYLNINFLYWADRYSDLWLSNTIEKVDIYNPHNPIFGNIYEAIQFSKGHHRIW